MIFAVTYRYTDDTETRDAVRAEHRDHLRALAADGKLLISGPFAPGEPAGALLLFRAETRDEVAGWIAADPFSVRGVVAESTTTEYLPVLGSLLPAFEG
ncbi:YciI family protein [Modestobacter sp. Leaf380]|uniref:YciI family protein n=1 Tax=Modestobacter sp. Leaf380 TaxID=1736356 RepID=UPI0006F5C3D6|nr:YciI family protein [Modestobacter sp. Leaf380]KQS63626.1 hypothetical protein ASG41_18445 [Modestobacter sp. Leaf380]